MNFSKISTKALALVLVFAMVATPVAAVGLDYTSDSTQTAETYTEWTKKNHQLGWGVAQYEDDNGDLVEAPMKVNESADNPFSFYATHINFSDAGKFPHAKSNVSALDANEWTTSGAAISVSNAEPKPGVEAVHIATDGSMTVSSTATATFDNFSIDSDENKKYLQAGIDISTLDSGAVVEVRVIDADGDEKVAYINGSATLDEDVIATTTGQGFIYQRQLGKMATVSNGDGTFNNVESVKFTVKDGDADVTVSMLNLDRMSKYKYGVEKVDTDDDDDLESEDIFEVKEPGRISVHSLGSIDDTLDGAVIKDLVVDATFTTEMRDQSEVQANFTKTDEYPGYYGTATIYLPTGLPSAYDISFANAKTTMNQSLPEDRFMSIEYAEGIGDTEYDEVESWTDVTSAAGAKHTEIVVDDTVQPGQTSVIKLQLKLTSEEYKSMKSVGGAVFGPGGSGGSGWGNIPIFGSILVALGGFWARIKGMI